ncbi:hypothetical protein N5P37_007799 [Trichoderma harzianum]|nr:hypothetical protein N5P37_007799 [Trichoderma harzianum]
MAESSPPRAPLQLHPSKCPRVRRSQNTKTWPPSITCLHAEKPREDHRQQLALLQLLVPP